MELKWLLLFIFSVFFFTSHNNYLFHIQSICYRMLFELNKYLLLATCERENKRHLRYLAICAIGRRNSKGHGSSRATRRRSEACPSIDTPIAALILWPHEAHEALQTRIYLRFVRNLSLSFRFPRIFALFFFRFLNFAVPNLILPRICRGADPGIQGNSCQVSR